MKKKLKAQNGMQATLCKEIRTIYRKYSGRGDEKAYGGEKIVIGNIFVPTIYHRSFYVLP